MPADRGTVLVGARDRDLELARQESELRVQGAPLAHHFAIGPRVDLLVGGDAGQCVAGDVSYAVAAGLDAVHVDRCQPVHHVGGFCQRDPVVLQVLACREVAVAAVELARDRRELMQLAAVELAIGNGHTQHRRMALHVPAVLQPQCAEVVLRQFAGEVAVELVTELGGALAHELAVEFVVGVHRGRLMVES